MPPTPPGPPGGQSKAPPFVKIQKQRSPGDGEKSCPTCSGTGSVNTHACPTCHGSGVVHESWKPGHGPVDPKTGKGFNAPGAGAGDGSGS